MRRLFSDETRFQRMLDAEAALARPRAKPGVIPQDAADTITDRARTDILDPEVMRERTETVWLPGRRTSWTPVSCRRCAMPSP